MPPGEPHQVPRQDVEGHLPGDGGKGEEVPFKPHREEAQDQGEGQGEEKPQEEARPGGKARPLGEEGGGVGRHPHEGRLGEARHPPKPGENVKGKGHQAREGEEVKQGEGEGEGGEEEGKEEKGKAEVPPHSSTPFARRLW